MSANVRIENKILKGGKYKYVIGVDEVGLGAIAGLICACAVILDLECAKKIKIKLKRKVLKINDSKVFNRQERDKLLNELVFCVIDYGFYSVDVDTINKIKNIMKCAKIARIGAIKNLNLIQKYNKSDFYVIIDGNFKHKELEFENESIVKADAKSITVAAASIIAKCLRDRYMLKMDQIFPEFSWKTNVGYRSKFHFEAIKKYGYTDLHRIYLIKDFIEKYDIKKYEIK